MGENVKEINKYSLPYKVNSSLKWYTHILYILLTAMFIGGMFIPTDDTSWGIVYKAICALLALLLAFIWMYAGVFKKVYIELTDDYFKHRALFGLKLVKWNEIYDVQIYKQNHNTMLGIIKKDKVKKRKDSFATVLGDMFGGQFSIAISLMLFPSVNIEQLYATIVDKLIEVNKDASVDIEDTVNRSEVKDEEDRTNSYPIALIKSILLSIAIGVGYGLTIYFLKCNILIIPIFGTMAILYTYLKNYKEKKINVFLRIIFGLVCTIQILFAAVVVIFIDSKLPINLDNFNYVVLEYFKYLFRYASDKIWTIVIAAICFFMGAVQGHTFKIEKIFKKIFMKKINNIYFKKDGRIITIYLKDPVIYNEEEEGKLFSQINEGCLIEKKNKKVTGFCIPRDFIEELGVSMGGVSATEIENKSFLKVDLGGGGEYQSYAFPCVLILNCNKQVELIQIQV